MKCCICGKEITNFGNNPEGACKIDENDNIYFPEFNAEDRCCDDCNNTYVIPGRIYKMINKE